MRDEPQLVVALLSGEPAISRNRDFDLMSSDLGRRARRRAGFLRSIARDIETTRVRHGAVTIDHGPFARGALRLVIYSGDFVRRAYLTSDEVALLTRVFPLVACVIDPHATG
ncbi:MAG: hypothetical protein WCJ30_04925 [Deltaproteobacteria bacterium]